MSRKKATTKQCERCAKKYGPGTRKPHAFAKSRFCSLKCANASRYSTMERILTRIKPEDPTTGCKIWMGSTIGKGYGRTRLNGRKVLAHRVVWEYYKGPIPDDLQIDHMCGAKLCCNVEHMRLVTARENSLADTSNNMAARNYRRQKCPKCGGPYSAFPNGIRYCPPCRHAKMMAYQRWRRAEQKAGRPGLKREE